MFSNIRKLDYFWFLVIMNTGFAFTCFIFWANSAIAKHEIIGELALVDLHADLRTTHRAHAFCHCVHTVISSHSFAVSVKKKNNGIHPFPLCFSFHAVNV